MTGDRVHAERCREIGLATAVVDDDDAGEVDRAALALARRLADGPHFALRMTKKMLGEELELGLDAAIEAEAQAQTLCMHHPDFREANDAWREGRKPAWR
jgi:enoyl-CoA hydratase/carnithine racemase